MSSETRAIANLLLSRVVETMTEQMIDVVPDETRVGLFRSGKLQSSPLVAKLNVLVREGSDEWPDILVPKDYPLKSPQLEMGGTMFFLRRFIAEYELFFIGTATRSQARTDAHINFSRFHSQIMKLPLNDLTDDFNETAVGTLVSKLVTDEGGGPPQSFIWRATHYFEFLTGIDYL